MTLRTIFLYLLGRREAIEAVAANKYSVFVGLLLVLSAGIAREYDQTFIGENFLKFFEPVPISLAASLIIFLCVYGTFRLGGSRSEESYANSNATFFSQYKIFLGLFWMTAPLAWIYAIPVERFTDSYASAKLNLTFLAVVAAWRVFLLARAASVTFKVPYVQSLVVILAPACFEAFMASTMIGMSLLKIMSGLARSREEELIGSVLSLVTPTSLFLGMFCVLIVGVASRTQKIEALTCAPKPNLTKTPAFGIAFILLTSCILMIPSQRQLKLNYEYEEILKRKQYDRALAYLNAHDHEDFAPARVLQPDPYEYRVFRELPGLFKNVTGNEKEWIQSMLLQRLEVLLQHHWILSYHPDTNSPPDYISYIHGLKAMPQAKSWISKHYSVFTNKIVHDMDRRSLEHLTNQFINELSSLQISSPTNHP